MRKLLTEKVKHDIILLITLINKELVAIERNTIQRDLIMNAVHKLNHPTAEAVYEEIIINYPSISKATVYRNLSRLAELGELKKIDTTVGADHFDITTENHYHMMCRTCGKVIDAPVEYSDDLLSKASTSEFKADAHDIIFYGICMACES